VFELPSIPHRLQSVLCIWGIGIEGLPREGWRKMGHRGMGHMEDQEIAQGGMRGMGHGGWRKQPFISYDDVLFLFLIQFVF